MTIAQQVANMRFLEGRIYRHLPYGTGIMQSCIVCGRKCSDDDRTGILPIVGAVFVCARERCQMRYQELKQTPDSAQVWEALFI